YLAQLRGVAPAAARARGLELLERFGLGDRAKDKLEALSLGNQQRVQ
ncbi:MAG TPA: ABC transporter ATP-binding protein, partial [Dermacoccus sp.]|nr:ABC transporter ATP-binding protein [Dermacoccus sp.]